MVSTLRCSLESASRRCATQFKRQTTTHSDPFPIHRNQAAFPIASSSTGASSGRHHESGRYGSARLLRAPRRRARCVQPRPAPPRQGHESIPTDRRRGCRRRRRRAPPPWPWPGRPDAHHPSRGAPACATAPWRPIRLAVIRRSDRRFRGAGGVTVSLQYTSPRAGRATTRRRWSRARRSGTAATARCARPSPPGPAVRTPRVPSTGRRSTPVSVDARVVDGTLAEHRVARSRLRWRSRIRALDRRSPSSPSSTGHRNRSPHRTPMSSSPASSARRQLHRHRSVHTTKYLCRRIAERRRLADAGFRARKWCRARLGTPLRSR